jgi:hypothetical protein
MLATLAREASVMPTIRASSGSLEDENINILSQPDVRRAAHGLTSDTASLPGISLGLLEELHCMVWPTNWQV